MDIVIHSQKFRLIGKIEGKIVRIQCLNSYHRFEFDVYRNELGLWCLVVDEKLGSKEGTLIHFYLQQFINQKINQLPEIQYPMTIPISRKMKPMNGTEDYPDWEHINDEAVRNLLNSRQLLTSPFNDLQPTNWSNTLKNEFEVNETDSLYPHEFNFKNVSIKGFIRRMVLERKVNEEPRLGPRRMPNISNASVGADLPIFLYYLYVKCFPGKVNDTEIAQVHCIPILLTNENGFCNELGLYNQYIPSENFICNKMFEKDEVTYIGLRYLNMFPFQDVTAVAIEPSGGKRKRKSRNRTKRNISKKLRLKK